MTISPLKRALLGLLLGVSMLTTGCLNPNMINQTLGGLYPTAPGDQPFLLVRVINDTTATLDVPIVFDDGSGAPPYMVNELSPAGKESSVLLHWPVLRLAIGDLDNPLESSIVASFPDGNTVSVPFGYSSLTAGQDYNSGDVVIFHIVKNSQNPAFINVSIGVIDGSTQQGTFSRASTFENVRLLLLQNGFIDATPLP